MIISIDELYCASLVDLREIVRRAPKKRLKHVSLYDFLLVGNVPLKHLHGVYAFYDMDAGNCLYVGKVQKPQFIERVPAHLASSQDSWFNGFLRYHSRATASGNLDQGLLTSRECQLILVTAPSHIAQKLEAILIHILNPSYNERRPKLRIPPDSYSDSETLSSLLRRLA